MAFTGFPADALTFYAGLEADNSRTYWLEHKAVYDHEVKGVMLDLAEALGERFSPVYLFRPNRDVRFSKDKSPYKTACGAVHEREGGAINYVQISAAGLFVATGMYHLAKDQLERLRLAIDDDGTGPAFSSLATELPRHKIELRPGIEPPLKRAPRGISPDHPRIEWLRWKGAIAAKEVGAPRWIHTAAAAPRIIELWDAAEPLNQWLERHVGPSQSQPDEADLR